MHSRVGNSSREARDDIVSISGIVQCKRSPLGEADAHLKSMNKKPKQGRTERKTERRPDSKPSQNTPVITLLFNKNRFLTPTKIDFFFSTKINFFFFF